MLNIMKPFQVYSERLIEQSNIRRHQGITLDEIDAIEPSNRLCFKSCTRRMIRVGFCFVVGLVAFALQRPY